jgi:putative spermidine/putrescine transport system permease protein
MALPTYATTGQRIGYYSYLTYCGFVFFFLIAPIFIILPLSFSASPFFEFTRGFMH